MKVYILEDGDNIKDNNSELGKTNLFELRDLLEDKTEKFIYC